MVYVAAGLVVVLVSIASLHVYWACGGRWGADVAVPEVNGRPAFQPGMGATLVVAALLVAAATLVAMQSGVLRIRFVPRWLPKTATWIVGFVFLLRSIGDFRRAGFFKSDSGTRFAALDTALYSPLCLVLAAGCIAVAWAR